MSNLDTDPAEVVCDDSADTRQAGAFELLTPREVPLGGPRAMTVRRTLPQRARSLIGAWCFVDHYGPDDVTDRDAGMVVPPHPHTGLQTVSWLFEGEIEHRDSTGAHQFVRPAELNLMTAGAGIQHSEVSTPATRRLHGAQLWVALPDRDRHTAPFFEHTEPAPAHVGEATMRVFIGELGDQRATARVFTPLLGAQLDLPAGASVDVPVDPRFEHGVLVDHGHARIGGAPESGRHGNRPDARHDVAAAELGYVAPGLTSLRITAGDDPLRVLLIGGEPLGEAIVMWWNFIGRDHDEVVAFRERWQSDVIDDADRAGRFGHVDGYDGPPLPAPALPGVRLKPRD